MAVNQASILSKARYYIDKQNRFLKFQSGYCNGLTFLWLYYMSIDNEAYFFEQIELLRTAKKAPIDTNTTRNVDEFLNAMIWLQLQHAKLPHLSQSSFSEAFELIKSSTASIQTEFAFAFLLNRDEIITVLQQVITANKMLHLSNASHAMGMMLKNGKYHFYDCNNPDGKLSFDTLEELVDEYIKSYDHRGTGTKYYAFGVLIYDYTHKIKPKYPQATTLVKQFLAQRGNIDGKDDSGITALWVLAQNNQLAVAENLLRRGATVNTKNFEHLSPLNAACMNGHLEMVALLLRYNANLHLKTKKHKTNLHLATLSGNSILSEYLIKQGIAINDKDYKGRTALHIAAKNDLDNMIKVLIKHGANINARDRNGHTPLYLALMNNNESGARLLLSLGVNINAVDEKLHSALHQATIENQLTALTFLLQQGANKKLKDYDGYTPSHLAVIQYQRDCLKQLMANEMDIDFLNELLILAEKRALHSLDKRANEMINLIMDQIREVEQKYRFTLFQTSHKQPCKEKSPSDFLEKLDSQTPCA